MRRTLTAMLVCIPILTSVFTGCVPPHQPPPVENYLTPHENTCRMPAVMAHNLITLRSAGEPLTTIRAAAPACGQALVHLG